MANLSIEYGDKDILKCTFSEDSTLLENLNLLNNIMQLAGQVSLKIIELDNNAESDMDAIITAQCLSYLKLSEFYKVNKKILELPVPCVSPLLSFDRFKKS